jgi:hypothetical protein
LLDPLSGKILQSARESSVGYDVHITRKKDWSDKDGPEINLEEWVATVRSDPEMRLDGAAEAVTSSGDRLRYENEGLAVWTGNPGHEVWFDYRRGRIVVKNPDQQVLRKMYALAQRLSGRVVGDEGEVYDDKGELRA